MRLLFAKENIGSQWFLSCRDSMRIMKKEGFASYDFSERFVSIEKKCQGA